MEKTQNLPGIKKLQAFFDQGNKKKDFAEALGIKPPHLSQILSGYRPVLTLSLAAKIIAATDGKITITWTDFLDPDDRAAIDALNK